MSAQLTNSTNEAVPSIAPPILLTVPEACHQLHISRWMLYRLIQQQQLTTIKLGRRRLVPQSAITGLVERLAQEAD